MRESTVPVMKRADIEEVGDVHPGRAAASQRPQDLLLRSHPVVTQGWHHTPFNQSLEPLVVDGSFQVRADGHHFETRDGVQEVLKVRQGHAALCGGHSPKVIHYRTLEMERGLL